MVLASAATAVAQEDYRHGRIRDVEATVTLQREAEPGAEEAFPNSPFLPGDRVWTDARGRAEFQFPDGAVLRLDSRGKLDYVTHEEARGERVVLKLWSGGLYLRTPGDRRGAAVLVETPAGVVETHERGTYRIDVDSGETRLSVYEGEAVLDGGGRRVDVDTAERAYVRRGEDPERPRSFDRREDDEFAAWDRARQGRETFVDGGRRYLPEELDAYSGELESNGAWRYETSIGYVWQPYVEVGWSPYTRGRWSWTSYGWTWVPSERWGWAPFHYGRWGQSAAFGWYWIPGRTWSPVFEQDIALAEFSLAHERLQPFHRHIALGRRACLLHEIEHLTKANGVDGKQQEIQKKGLDVSGERAKADEECTADHIGDAQRHHCLRQQGRDKEHRADQGKHVGQGDVGQHNFQQAIEQCVGRNVVGVEAQLHQDLCDPEVVRRRVQNAV